MAHQRSFRFGTAVFTAPSREAWIALACKVVDLGYTTLSIPDHFQEQLAPFTALMAVADAFPALRIGSYVFANDFRHPAVLAKEAATLYATAGSADEGAAAAQAAVAQAAQNYGLPGLALELSGAWCRGCTVTAAVTVEIPAVQVPMIGTIGDVSWTATSSSRVEDYASL